MVQDSFQRVGLRAAVEGVGTYARDVRRMNSEQEKLGNSADRAAKKAENLDKRLRAVGSRMAESGRQAVFLGTALLAIAAGPAFVAARFDSAFVKIENLVGESREALQGMRQDVLDISKDTARGPQELADALFVIESGGLRGAEAIDTLRAAASAAALGLGDTASISRLTTQALLAFRDQNLTAADAVDILVGTARAGNFETSQLAGVFGSVLPLAAELGVKFSDLGGFVATYTRVGGDAASATTALSAVLTALTRGGTAAIKTLDEVGLSLEDLREVAREEGLAQALFAILEAVEKGGEGATEKLALIIPNIRALRGVLATAGVQSEEFLKIQEEVANSLGLTAEGLERLQDDPLFKFQKAVNELKIALIEMGTAAAPALAILTTLIAQLAGAITALPGPLQQALAAFTSIGGALLLLGGTVSIFIGSMLQLIPTLIAVKAAMAGVGLASVLMTGGIIGVVAIAAIAVGGLFLLKEANERAAAAAREQAVANIAQEAASRLSADAIRAQIAVKEQFISKLREELALEELAIQQGSGRIDGIGQQVAFKQEHIRTSIALSDQIENEQLAYDGLTTALSEVELREQQAAAAAAEVEQAAADAAKKIEEMTRAAERLSSAAISSAFALQFLEFSALEGFDADRFLVNAREIVQAMVAREGALDDITDILLRVFDTEVPSSSVEKFSGGLDDAASSADDFGRAVEDAFARARRAAESDLDLLGELVRTALTRAAGAARDAQIAAIEAVRDAAESAFEDRIAQLDEQERRELEAIQGRLSAITGPLQAEIDALDTLSQAEDRAEIERRLALAFDARERARIEEELRDFDRAARIENLREQIGAAKDAANNETDAAQDAFDDRRSLLNDELDAQKDAYDAQVDAARDAYDRQTDEFALNSEARRLILEEEFDAISLLLEAQVPEWRERGLSWSEALLDGLRAGGVEDFVANLGGGVGRGRAAGGAAPNPAAGKRDEQLAGLQVNGVSLKAKGAPEFVIEGLRNQIRDIGGIPIFHQGGTVPTIRGNSSREVIIRALPGETVSPRGGGGPTFEEGAFRGMFSGATFAGSPQENATEFERAFERAMDRSLKRGAHVAGGR